MFTFACLSVFFFAGGTFDTVRQDAKPESPGPASELKPAPAIREFPVKDPQPKSLKVADVIKGLGLDETKMRYDHEPPGVLQELCWTRTKLPGTDVEVEVVIQLGGPRLFSDKAGWDIKAVRAATVLKVTISPPRPLD